MVNMLVWGIFKPLVNAWHQFTCGVAFLIYKALASVLDALTHLFFIFAGMTPVGNGSNADTGEVDQVDIVNFFLQKSEFQSAYFKLCLIALGLIIAFTIGRIIKEDYFDKSGPRSKGPIFRNVALSFIAFICIIPVFYFLISACGALALAVMKAMGYEGTGLGTMLFEMCWENGTVNGTEVLGINQFKEIATALGGEEDANYFSWYPTTTYFHYKYNVSTAEAWAGTGLHYDGQAGEPLEFYWYVYLFGALILILQLMKMILAMLERIYKLITLFLIAPSPISQIVLDNGQKFKQWTQKVVQEGLKVVGCVMSFMVFVMIITAVGELDLTQFVYTPSDPAYSASIIEANGLTKELSNVNLLYYGGDTKSGVDYLINAVGKMCLILAGGGAIADIDATLSPLLSGASSSLDMGEAGKSVMAAGKAGVGLAKDALNKTADLAGAAVGGVAGLVGKHSLAKKAAKESLNSKLEEGKKGGGPGGTPGPGDGGKTTEKATTPSPGQNGPGGTTGAGDKSGEGATGEKPEAAQTPENNTQAAQNANGENAGAENENNPAAEGNENDDAANTPERENAPDPNAENSNETGEGEEASDAATDPSANGENPAAGESEEATEAGAENSGPQLSEQQKEDFAKGEAWKATGGNIAKTAFLKAPLKVLGTAGKLAGSTIGAVLRATGYGAVVDEVVDTAKGVAKSAQTGFVKGAGPAYAKYAKMKAKNKADAKASKAESKMGTKAEKFIKENDLKAAANKADPNVYNKIPGSGENPATGGPDGTKAETGTAQTNTPNEPNATTAENGNNEGSANENNVENGDTELKEKATKLREEANKAKENRVAADEKKQNAEQNMNDAHARYERACNKCDALDNEKTFREANETKEKSDEWLKEAEPAYMERYEAEQAWLNSRVEYDEATVNANEAASAESKANEAATQAEKDYAATTTSSSETSAPKTESASSTTSSASSNNGAASSASSGKGTTSSTSGAAQKGSASTAPTNTEAISSRVNSAQNNMNDMLSKQGIQKESPKFFKRQFNRIKCLPKLGEHVFGNARNAKKLNKNAPEIKQTSNDMRNTAKNINANALAQGKELNKELLYSGNMQTETNYANAARSYADAQMATDRAQADYDNAKANGRSTSEIQHYKSLLAEAKANQDVAQVNYNKANKARNKEAKKNKTALYQQVQAEKDFDNAINETGGKSGWAKVASVTPILRHFVNSSQNKSRAAKRLQKASNNLASQMSNANDALKPTTGNSTPTDLEVEVVDEANNDSPVSKVAQPEKKTAPRYPDKKAFEKHLGEKKGKIRMQMKKDGINKNLQEACYQNMAINETMDNSDVAGGSFTKNITHECNKAFKELHSDCDSALSDEDLQKAIDSIDLSKINDEMLKGSNLKSKDDYKSNVKNRYDSAVKSYSDSVNKAKEAAAQRKELLKSGKTNTELEQKIRDALAQAYKDDMTISSINIELKNVQKEEK